MKILIFISICLFSSSVIAQDVENIVVNDSRIDTLTSTQIEINTLKKGIDGFKELSNFIKFFELNTNDLKSLETYFKSSNVMLSIFELSKADKNILTTQIKAYIARNIWNDDGFFPVIHTIDNTFQKAIMQ